MSNSKKRCIYNLKYVLDKPKRRSKKRKTVQFDTNENGCTEIESSEQKNADIDCEHHLNDYYYEAPEFNAQGVTDRTLENFVDEEKVFNEWLQSCMKTNTIVLNSSFLELLNFFTDRGQCDMELFNGKPTDDMATEQTRVGKIFASPSVSGERIVSANDQPMRNVDRLFRLRDDVRPSGYTGCSQVASTSAAHEINDCMENTDSKDMFDGHTDHSTFVKPIGIRTLAICDGSHEPKLDQNSRTGQLNFNDMLKSQLADGYTDDFIVRNTSLPVRPFSVDADDYNPPANIATGAIVQDDDQDEDDEIMGNLDFEELFKSQRADRFIEKYSEEIAAERPNVDHLVVACSGGGKKAETCHEKKINLLLEIQISDNDDVDQTEADEVKSNVDLKKLHKSQRSYSCLENDIAAGRQNVDRSISNCNRRSRVVGGGGQKEVTSGHQSIGNKNSSVLYKNQRSDGCIEDFVVRKTEPRMRPSNAVDRILFHIDDDKDKDNDAMEKIDSEKLFKGQRAAKCMKINEIDKISAKRSNVNRSIINDGRRSPVVCGGASGKVNYDALFKSQRSDEYTKDYMDKSIAKKVGVADDLPGSDVGVDDDDVISINSSQEFFSCRPLKKATQTKLMGHVCTDRAIKIVDLSSPPSSSCTVAASAGLPIAVDRFPIDSVSSTSHVSGKDLLQQTNDDDDMDFMFIDYNSDGDAAADIFTQKHRDCGDADVFTQRHRDGGDADVFTQKHRDCGDADFFSQKKRDISGTKAAVSLPLSPVASVAKLPLKSDVTKRAGHSTQSYDNGMMPFNIMKAARLVDLLKPGLSMKRNTTAATSKRQVDKGSTAVGFKKKVDNCSPVAALKQQIDKGSTTMAFKRQVGSGSPVAALKRRVNNASPVAGIKRQFDNGSMAALALKRKVANYQSPADGMSPIHPPNGQRRRPQFSQSTPKVTVQSKQQRREVVTTSASTVTTAGKVNSLLTSSSDSDTFVGYGCIEKTTSPRRRVKKKRRRKPKKVSIVYLRNNAIIIRLTSLFGVSTI